jgi:hypothetical protein
MAKRRIASVDEDFSRVLRFLKSSGMVPKVAGGQLTESARRIHRCTYSLILWRFRLKGMDEHAAVFLEEIASDALQILPQTLMGYSKTAKLLTRGIIENTLRHLYFIDHPIEFARMNRDGKWFPTMEMLFEYPKIHPVFRVAEKRFDALNRLSTLYDDLSASVHGRTVQDLEMRLALQKIVYEEHTAKEQARVTERVTEATNFVLARLHSDQVASFGTDDRRIILQTMPARAKQVWNEPL